MRYVCTLSSQETTQHYIEYSSVAQSCPTLQPHRLQRARLPCPSPTPGAYSNSCPSRWWCHPTISSSVLPFSSSQHQVFSSESALCIRWPKDWNFRFNISPSNECSGLISFRIDWFVLLLSKGLSRVFSSITVRKH